MINETFEKREQMLQLRARVLQAEQERIDGAPTMSVAEARAKPKVRSCEYNGAFFVLPGKFCE